MLEKAHAFDNHTSKYDRVRDQARVVLLIDRFSQRG